jgi:hypothetical protein
VTDAQYVVVTAVRSGWRLKFLFTQTINQIAQPIPHGPARAAISARQATHSHVEDVAISQGGKKCAVGLSNERRAQRDRSELEAFTIFTHKLS